MRVQRFRDRLVQLADEAEFTQAQLADRAGLDRSHICRLMNGSRSLTGQVAAKLCAALNLGPHTLLVGTDVAHLLDAKGEIEGAEDAVRATRELQGLRDEVAELRRGQEADRRELAAARAERAAFADVRVRLERLEPELRAVTSALSRLTR